MHRSKKNPNHLEEEFSLLRSLHQSPQQGVQPQLEQVVGGTPISPSRPAQQYYYSEAVPQYQAPIPQPQQIYQQPPAQRPLEQTIAAQYTPAQQRPPATQEYQQALDPAAQLEDILSQQREKKFKWARGLVYAGTIMSAISLSTIPILSSNIIFFVRPTLNAIGPILISIGALKYMHANKN